MKQRQFTYTDPLKDDFAGNHIQTQTVDKNYPFVSSNTLWNIGAFLVYYLVAVPIVWVITKLYLGLRFKNRKAFRKIHKTGYFLYVNHTRDLDAFLPPMAAFPKKAYTIAGADAVSIKGIRNLVLMLGGMPIPTVVSGMPEFMKAVDLRYRQHNCVAIFPEAHIWPFYTGIRPFPSTSFRYPAKLNAPVVAMAVTYRKRKGLFRFVKKPGMTVTVSEPFYPDPALPLKERQEELRNKAYRFMKTVAAESENVEYIHYIYKPEEDRKDERMSV